jgi:hypothetical protein
MDVITAFAGTGFAVSFEGFFNFVEMVGFWAKVAERMITRFAGFSDGSAECHAIQTVQAIAFNYGGVYVLTAKNILKSALGGSGAGAR